MSSNERLDSFENSMSVRLVDLENIFLMMKEEQERSHNAAMAQVAELRTNSMDVLIDLRGSYENRESLGKQLASLEDELVGAKGRIELVEAQKSVVEAQLETIQSVNSQLLARIQQLEHDCSGLTTSVQSLEADKEMVARNVVQMKKDNTALSARIKDLEAEVTHSLACVKTLEHDLTTKNTEMRTASAASNARITQLEEAESLAIMYQGDLQKDKIKSDRRVESLQEEKAQLEARVRELQDALAQGDLNIASITADMIKEKMLAAEQDQLLAMERKKVAQLTRTLESTAPSSRAAATDTKSAGDVPDCSTGKGTKLSSYVMDHMKQAKSKLATATHH